MTAAPLEIELHKLVAKTLKEHCLPDWRYFHIPNGGRLDVRTATRLKSMGVIPGAPDFILISPQGTIRCLELKRSEKSPLTKGQKDFRMFCVTHGISYVVAWTIDQTLSAFRIWNCTRLDLWER